MEDGGKQAHTFGGGQPRNQHPRPFFYVQPPSQPYYLYQHWQMNNPYTHYGLPGGFNFNRPCLHPYQYMQYPGFVFPHAPLYPVDYRRMFEPRFHAPSWGDAPRQQQQQHHPPQPHQRRETACSEAQTDPSDAITKLIECLDKIRATELQGGGDRELDSGVASQSSGMFSPGEEKKSEEASAADVTGLESPAAAAAFSDSTTAVYDGETSHRSLDVLSPEGCWLAGLEEEEEEELPLDSSSIHGEGPELEQPTSDERFLPLLHKAEATDIQSDVTVADQSVPPCEAGELLKKKKMKKVPTPPSAPPPPSSQTLLKEARTGEKVPKTDSDPRYRILKLPFESVLASGEAGRLSSSSPTAAAAASSSSAAAAAASPYYYNYLSMRSTHERLSVLSPSLDELSSRDEMFSTDMDDPELFPKHVYAGRRLAEVVGGSPQGAADEEEEEVEVEDDDDDDEEEEEEEEGAWVPGAKRSLCACCGKNLAKGAGRSKTQKMFRDEGGDSEEDGRYGRVRVVVRKHGVPRRPHPHPQPHPLPQRHPPKPWYKRGQYKESPDPVKQQEEEEEEEVHDVCKKEAGEEVPGDVTGPELQCRTCRDRLCRDEVSDQGRWGDGDVVPRRRQATPLPRQETSAQRKVMYHRPRDEDNDDEEPPPIHWERGSTMREPRC